MIERVLLIEDTISSRSTLFTIISTVAEVIRARSIIEAAAQCEQLNPCVIVADCPIEGEDAAGVLAAMKSEQCHKPLIIVSAEGSGEAAAALVAQGAFAHLRKPASEVELVAAIWRAVDSKS